MSRKTIPVFVVLTLGLAAPAGGGDGVIEINQARAMAGGINGSLVEDPPGFPVRITQPGSYRLTGNLIVPDGNTTAVSIGITATFVTVDLGGFAIRGPNQVILSPLSCTAGGAGGIGSGIDSVAPWTTVRNGYVSGMGQDGVALQAYGRIEGVTAVDNCGIGLWVGSSSAIVDSIARRNFHFGFYVEARCLLKNFVAVENGSDGIAAGEGSSVLDGVSASNVQYGISCPGNVGIGHVTFNNNTLGWGFAGQNLGCNVVNNITYCPGHP